VSKAKWLDETGKHYLHIVFDGPPGPEAGRFVEVEDDTGKSVRFGEWVQREDGYWVLRVARPAPEERLRAEATQLRGLVHYFLTWIDSGFLVPLNRNLARVPGKRRRGPSRPCW
jgi:hypothetical protein